MPTHKEAKHTRCISVKLCSCVIRNLRKPLGGQTHPETGGVVGQKLMHARFKFITLCLKRSYNAYFRHIVTFYVPFCCAYYVTVVVKVVFSIKCDLKEI